MSRLHVHIHAAFRATSACVAGEVIAARLTVTFRHRAISSPQDYGGQHNHRKQAPKRNKGSKLGTETSVRIRGPNSREPTNRCWRPQVEVWCSRAIIHSESKTPLTQYSRRVPKPKNRRARKARHPGQQNRNRAYEPAPLEATSQSRTHVHSIACSSQPAKRSLSKSRKGSYSAGMVG